VLGTFYKGQFFFFFWGGGGHSKAALEKILDDELHGVACSIALGSVDCYIIKFKKCRLL